MSEESKAIEEVAKATGKAIDASRELGGLPPIIPPDAARIAGEFRRSNICFSKV